MNYNITRIMAYFHEHSFQSSPIMIWLCKDDAHAANFLTKAIYYAEWKHGEPFYKFLLPPANPNEYYKEGDSWQEEFYSSRSNITRAAAAVCTRIGKGASKKTIAETPKLSSMFFCWTGEKNVTWYEMNFKLVNVVMDELFNHTFDSRRKWKAVRTHEDFWKAVAARKDEYEFDANVTYENVFGGGPKESKALAKKQNTFDIEVAGETYKATMISASSGNYKYPRLTEKISMHDDFEPTQAQVDFARSIGYTDPEIMAFTARQVNWFINKPNEKRPGWWGTWHTNLLGDYAKRKGGNNGQVRQTASDKRVEQFKQIAGGGLFDDVTD